MLTLGMPDQHQGFIEFWESQGGTIGTPPPMTNFINKQLTKLLNNHIEAPKELTLWSVHGNEAEYDEAERDGTQNAT